MEKEESLTVCVCIDLCEGAQGEADAVLRAGKTHISQERRHHHVLVCGDVPAQREKKHVSRKAFTVTQQQ